MIERFPRIIEQYDQTRSALDMVLGASLGAYIGLTVSENGVNGGTYFEFGIFLFFTCLFAVSIHAFGDRLHRMNFPVAAVWLLAAMGSALFSFQNAATIQGDPMILLTLFAVWFLIIGMRTVVLIGSVLAWRVIE